MHIPRILYSNILNLFKQLKQFLQMKANATHNYSVSSHGHTLSVLKKKLQYEYIFIDLGKRFVMFVNNSI